MCYISEIINSFISSWSKQFTHIKLDKFTIILSHSRILVRPKVIVKLSGNYLKEFALRKESGANKPARAVLD